MKSAKITLRAFGSILTASLLVGCGPTSMDSPEASAPPPSVSYYSLAPDLILSSPCAKCAAKSQPDESDVESFRRSKWITPGQRRSEGVLNLRVTDQEGRLHDL